MNNSLDTIKINFQFIDIPEDERDEYFPHHRTLELQVFINDKQIIGYIENSIILEWLEDKRWGDNLEYSNFHVITCNCGVPECNNINNGIFIDVSENTVTWTIPKDVGYEKYSDVLDKEQFVFDKQEYIKAFDIFPKIVAFIEQQNWSLKDTCFSVSSFQEIIDYQKKIQLRAMENKKVIFAE